MLLSVETDQCSAFIFSLFIFLLSSSCPCHKFLSLSTPAEIFFLNADTEYRELHKNIVFEFIKTMTHLGNFIPIPIYHYVALALYTA